MSFVLLMRKNRRLRLSDMRILRTFRAMRCFWVGPVFLVALLIIGSQATVIVEATQPAPVEEFVPIGELPEEERLPAAPFLISAYSIVWILAFGYFWMLSRRLSAVEREMVTLTKRRDDATGGTSESSF